MTIVLMQITYGDIKNWLLIHYSLYLFFASVSLIPIFHPVILFHTSYFSVSELLHGPCIHVITGLWMYSNTLKKGCYSILFYKPLLKILPRKKQGLVKAVSRNHVWLRDRGKKWDYISISTQRCNRDIVPLKFAHSMIAIADRTVFIVVL